MDETKDTQKAEMRTVTKKEKQELFDSLVEKMNDPNITIKKIQWSDETHSPVTDWTKKTKKELIEVIKQLSLDKLQIRIDEFNEYSRSIAIIEHDTEMTVLKALVLQAAGGGHYEFATSMLSTLVDKQSDYIEEKTKKECENGNEED